MDTCDLVVPNSRTAKAVIRRKHVRCASGCAAGWSGGRCCGAYLLYRDATTCGAYFRIRWQANPGPHAARPPPGSGSGAAELDGLTASLSARTFRVLSWANATPAQLVPAVAGSDRQRLAVHVAVTVAVTAVSSDAGVYSNSWSLSAVIAAWRRIEASVPVRSSS